MQGSKGRAAHIAAIIREVEPEVRPRKSFHPLVVIPTVGQLFAVCLSRRLVKVPTHWDAYKRKVMYCTGQGQCKHCASSFPVSVYGYACVQLCVSTGNEWSLDACGLLCLPHSSLTCNEQNITKRSDLRGRVLRVCRMKTKGQNRPVVVEVTDGKYKEPDLHSDWDVMEALAGLFGLIVPHRDN